MIWFLISAVWIHELQETLKFVSHTLVLPKQDCIGANLVFSCQTPRQQLNTCKLYSIYNKTLCMEVLSRRLNGGEKLTQGWRTRCLLADQNFSQRFWLKSHAADMLPLCLILDDINRISGSKNYSRTKRSCSKLFCPQQSLIAGGRPALMCWLTCESM